MDRVTNRRIKGKRFLVHASYCPLLRRTGCKPDIVLVNEESHHKKRIERNGTLCGINIIEGCISSNAINIHRDPAMFIRVITGFATMGLSYYGFSFQTWMH
ncbi:unnamed protein product [Rhizophagus irregularis]|uniref:Uncharacterized protein n=1 Tax=Rhizophagus irregularis TaxID=588596 RepID=A0A915ZM97_9GLOM|nr:unnamed protein product [Rhizophagus irregularis]